MAFASLILSALLLQFSPGCNALGDPGIDISLQVFFRVSDLYKGKNMPIYFASNADSTPTHLLSRKEADSIPFLSSKLPYLLEYFEFSKTSPQAKAMETTLRQCELKPKGEEFRYCVTSLESMLDKTQEFFGSVKPKVLSTRILSSNHALFQNYTFVEKPVEIYASKAVACHTMPYPYLVYYCHGHQGHKNRVFKIVLGGENKERIDAVAVCHMNTSFWDADHVAFRVLGGHPGSSPVCHVLPIDNVVWVA